RRGGLTGDRRRLGGRRGGLFLDDRGARRGPDRRGHHQVVHTGAATEGDDEQRDVDRWAHAHHRTGRRTPGAVPRARCDVPTTVPSCSCTIRYTTERPMPLPPGLLV